MKLVALVVVKRLTFLSRKHFQSDFLHSDLLHSDFPLSDFLSDDYSDSDWVNWGFLSDFELESTNASASKKASSSASSN